MALIDLAPPSVEPIDLDYAKTFLRVDNADEDTLISTLIKTARHQVENMIGRALIQRSFLYRGHAPKSKCLTLPRPPLIEVTRLSLIAENDVGVDIPATDYLVNVYHDPGEVRLKDAASWTDYLADFATLEIEFIAGYGDTQDDIPLPVKQAILLLLAQSYEHRDIGEKPQIPIMVDALLMPYRWIRI